MRPVARIAQSVEQGIENPRVLGSIPSPGTTYSENPAYGWVFAFLRPDSPLNCVRLFAAQRLTPSGPARQARCSTPAALVRVRAPLFKEPAQKAGFCFSVSDKHLSSQLAPRLQMRLRRFQVRQQQHLRTGYRRPAVIKNPVDNLRMKSIGKPVLVIRLLTRCA